MIKIISKDTFICKVFHKVIKFIRRNIFIDFTIKYVEHLKVHDTIRIGKIITFADYCIKNQLPYEVIEPMQPRAVFSQGYFEGNSEQCKEYESPAIILAEIYDVDIVGRSGFFLDEKYCIFDQALDIDRERFDFSYEPILRIKNDRIVYSHFNRELDIECGIFLLGFFPFNYFHVTVEILSKLQYVDKFEKYREYPILVDEELLKVDQFKDLLTKININKHPIIAINKFVLHRVKKMIFVSNNIWIPWLLRRGEVYLMRDFRMAKSSMTNISHIFNDVVSGNEVSPQKIYLSRGKQKNIRLKNEERIAKMFQRAGFVILYTETMSLDEQVCYFKNAEVIAGMAGAAFTNIIYCKKNTRIILFSPQEHRNYMYCTMAKLLGLGLICLDLKICERQTWLSDEILEMDEKYCERFINNCIAEK